MAFKQDKQAVIDDDKKGYTYIQKWNLDPMIWIKYMYVIYLIFDL